MKENQNGNSLDSISFGNETNPLIFGSKDRYELNDSRLDASLTELEAKDTVVSSNFKVADDSFMDTEKRTMISSKKAGQNGISRHVSMDNENGVVGSRRKEIEDGLSHQLSNGDKDTDSLSSYSSDLNKEQRSPEHKSLDTVEEFADYRSDSRDSSSPFFTNKNALEYDLPELEVCYKEIACQNLKNIHGDEGRHQNYVNVVESCMDEKPGCLVPQPPNDINNFEAEKDSSLDSDSSTADQCGSKNENDCNTLVSQERIDSCLKNSLEMDTVEHYKTENAAETGDTTGKAETDSSGEDLVDRMLPDKDFFGNQYSLGRGSKVMQLPDQVINQEAVPESSSASSTETGDTGNTGNDVQANCLLYDSKVENGSITFNFSSPEAVLVGNDMDKDAEEDSADTSDFHQEVRAVNLPDAQEEKVQCRSNRVDDSHGQSLTSNKNVEEQSAASGDVAEEVNANLPDSKDGKAQCTSDRADDSPRQFVISDKENSDSDKENSDGDSTTSYDQCARSEGSSCENAHEGSPGHKQVDADGNDPAEPSSNQIPGPAIDAPAAVPITSNHDGRDSGDVPFFSYLKHDMGETSFSSASMVAYSGPITFSGSLSHRSDGSTTSGKSFAFPVLQSEWNSSPVRMAKADRRHFRKHRGWRSGLLCCRF